MQEMLLPYFCNNYLLSIAYYSTIFIREYLHNSMGDLKMNIAIWIAIGAAILCALVAINNKNEKK